MTQRKRILLLGNPASIHIYNYVKNVLCKEGFDITIFYYCNEDSLDMRDEVASFYKRQSVQLVKGLKPIEYGKFGFLRYHKETVRLLKTLGPFDILHVHYIWYHLSPAIYKVRHLYKKIVLTYFGSDLYRISLFERLLTIPALSAADHITFMSEDMVDYYKTLPFYFRKYLKKSTVVDFGNMFYDRIASFDNKRGSCKKSLGFDDNKLLITIGYVGRPQMQQYETLSALLEDGRVLNSQVQFAIPAYGISKDSDRKILSLAKKYDIRIEIFTNFMGEEEVSTLRAATDIFIHAQTTDALSCAMLEHLYAGSVVVNGSWLRYGTLTKNNVYYKSFDSFDSLSDAIAIVIDNINNEEELSSHNREIISQISSWDGLRPIWLKLYS